MLQDLPRRSSLLPAFRDSADLLDQLQFRQHILTDSGDLTRAARMAVRADRVARWRARAETPKAAPREHPRKLVANRPEMPPPAAPVDGIDALIAGVSVERILFNSPIWNRVA